MGKEKSRLGERIRAWMVDYAYLVTLGCMLAIVACTAAYTLSLRQEEGVQATAEAMEIAQSVSPPACPQTTPLPTIAPLQVRYTQMHNLAWPLEGAVLRAYDALELVYWEQLGCWKAHTGLDIAGEEGDGVLACADGEVTACAWDELWGWRVMVGHEDGRSMLYAGLENSLVGQGAAVRRGQTLGTLMKEIPCEREWGTHLHLEMHREGKTSDPEAVLPDR